MYVRHSGYAAAITKTYLIDTEWKELRYRFAAVGYRIKELDPPMQALLTVIVAISSRITSHQNVVGQGDGPEPSMLGLESSDATSPLGDIRNDRCRLLFSEAETRINECLLGTPTAETVAAPYLLGSFYLCQPLTFPTFLQS